MSNTHFSWLKCFIVSLPPIKLVLSCIYYFVSSIFLFFLLDTKVFMFWHSIHGSTSEYIIQIWLHLISELNPSSLKNRFPTEIPLFNLLCNHHSISHTYFSKMRLKCGRNIESSHILSCTAPSIWGVPMVSLIGGRVLLWVYTGYLQIFPTIFRHPMKLLTINIRTWLSSENVIKTLYSPRDQHSKALLS